MLIPYKSNAVAVVRNDRNQAIEAGWLLVDACGFLYRAEESSGRNKAASGELTPRRIKPPKQYPEARAVLKDGKVLWQVEAMVDSPLLSFYAKSLDAVCGVAEPDRCVKYPVGTPGRCL